MVRKSGIIIIGGDKRQSYLYDILKSRGFDCLYENSGGQEALEKLKDCKYAILPIPVSRDGKYIYSSNSDFKLEATAVIDTLTVEQVVFGGSFGENLSCALDKKNVLYIDMNKNEDFLTYNAYLTAQGALCLLLNSTDRLITGKKVLITGFGRVAKALASALKGLNTDVYVCARNNNQLTEAGCMGYKTFELKSLGSVIYLFDYVFNTVPEKLFTENDISHLGDDSIYFELASKPFGANKDDFLKLNKQHKAADALPGRYLSFSAGERIAAFIEKLI